MAMFLGDTKINSAIMSSSHEQYFVPSGLNRSNGIYGFVAYKIKPNNMSTYMSKLNLWSRDSSQTSYTNVYVNVYEITTSTDSNNVITIDDGAVLVASSLNSVNITSNNQKATWMFNPVFLDGNKTYAFIFSNINGGEYSSDVFIDGGIGLMVASNLSNIYNTPYTYNIMSAKTETGNPVINTTWGVFGSVEIV